MSTLFQGNLRFRRMNHNTLFLMGETSYKRHPRGKAFEDNRELRTSAR